jgi:hypothetical protein
MSRTRRHLLSSLAALVGLGLSLAWSCAGAQAISVDHKSDPCNFTAHQQTVAFDLSSQGVSGHQPKMLLNTRGSPDPDSLASVKLPPYGVYIGQIQ